MTPPNVIFVPATAGLSLAIHDAFGGSGNADGRTPDTVDNGEAWESGATTNLITSGYLYADATSGGSNYTVVNPLASTFNIEAITQGINTGSSFRNGLYTNWVDTNNYERIALLQETELAHQYNVSGSLTTTILDTFSAIATSTDIFWEISCSASSLDYTLTVGGSVVTSGSVSPNYTPGKTGFWTRYANEARCYDFKVYT